ncbi:hypothetical protein OQH60_01795 [Campylobacter sp. MIT 21-1685]|uniref:hypothetical protein n=1 Tax=unclassified Campylobacter TaxID=2593542 RepID=UPI00224B597F|nr:MULTISPECIES: hypothetical protein [unclassified Campylobacter]MCX2682697.1 hypothetical protein [Campylobacter sp. MIT 21-1684]MCX2750977.1 hypothetical protein [Campylobacter sp. MIT 21-1682]MCX2807090.1 hypothetical protein [Campylobacter sp. MIT 21-1685]
MKTRLFSLASFIYIAIIAAFVFYLDLGEYTLSIANFSLHLPVAVWFIIPLVLFFFFSLLHMSFYGFLRSLKFKHFFKDAAKFENLIIDLLLEKEPKSNFSTKEFRSVEELVKMLKNHQKNPEFPKTNEILDLIDGVKRGEYVNLSKLKLEHNNVLLLQNEKNRINNDINYAYAKVKNCYELKDEYEELAFENLLKKGSYEQIKNNKVPKKAYQVLSLFKRFQNGDLKLSEAEYEVLLAHSNFNQEQYLSVAKMSVKALQPDALLGIFKKIKEQNSEALRAYLYLLSEFGLLDELREQIRSDEKEFNDFKAFLVLREKNIAVDLVSFIQ